MKFSFRLIALPMTMIFGSSCSGGSPTTPLTPTNTASKIVSETFITVQSADPKPLPDGSPQAFCGKEAKVSSTIKAVLTSLPGGTPVQIYLMTKVDRDTLGCSAKLDVCPGAISPETFVGSITKTWDVSPGMYCIVLRNRSETVQILSGGTALEYPLQ